MAVAARRWSKRRSVKKHGAERDGASKRKRRIEERWRGDESTRRREDAARRAEVEKAEAARGGLTQREGRGPPQGANWNYSARPPLFKLLLLSFFGRRRGLVPRKSAYTAALTRGNLRASFYSVLRSNGPPRCASPLENGGL